MAIAAPLHADRKGMTELTPPLIGIEGEMTPAAPTQIPPQAA